MSRHTLERQHHLLTDVDEATTFSDWLLDISLKYQLEKLWFNKKHLVVNCLIYSILEIRWNLCRSSLIRTTTQFIHRLLPPSDPPRECLRSLMIRMIILLPRSSESDVCQLQSGARQALFSNVLVLQAVSETHIWDDWSKVVDVE